MCFFALTDTDRLQPHHEQRAKMIFVEVLVAPRSMPLRACKKSVVCSLSPSIRFILSAHRACRPVHMIPTAGLRQSPPRAVPGCGSLVEATAREGSSSDCIFSPGNSMMKLTASRAKLPRTNTAVGCRRQPITVQRRFILGFMKLKRPRLPRITCCPSGGPLELDTQGRNWGLRHCLQTPIQKPILIPSKTRLDGLWGPIHPHPTAQQNPSKAHPKLVRMGSRRVTTIVGLDKIVHPSPDFDGRGWPHPRGGSTDIHVGSRWGFVDGKKVDRPMGL